MRHLRLFIALLTFSLAGCTPTPEAAPIPKEALVTSKQQPLAISEISQTMNISSSAAWENVLNVLNRYKIPAVHADRAEGRIDTDWIRVSDTMCGMYGAEGAPLSCEVRFGIKVSPISGVASSFKIRYEEVCRDLPNGTLECPDSNAERLMMAIAADVKAAAGIVDEE
jgi:hypothetical protein